MTNNAVIKSETSIVQSILKLKKEKKAIILAHYYQLPEIQRVADFIGDSLGLAEQAAKTDADIIVFCGVHFMAETAKILNPDKKVLLPDLNAGCSLAISCPPEKFQEFINQHPNHVVVSYINCEASIKAMSDWICTSSNAIQVINAIPPDKPIIFAPDKNLGKYLIDKTGRTMLLWDGVCEVHEAFSLEKLNRLREKHPSALLIAHPECEPKLLEIADFIGSTAAMLKFVQASEADTFIIATEAGILEQMQQTAAGKRLIPVPAIAENTCACSECSYMKLNTIEKLLHCLQTGQPEIKLADDLRTAALKPLQRMLNLSNPVYAN